MFSAILFMIGFFNTDSTLLTIDEVLDSKEIRIQLSSCSNNYTTADHHIFKLGKKEQDLYNVGYYYSNHVDNDARFIVNTKFTRDELSKLIILIYEIKEDERNLSLDWIWVNNLSYCSISTEEKVISVTSYLQKNYDAINSLLLRKVYIKHLQASLQRLKVHWQF